MYIVIVETQRFASPAYMIKANSRFKNQFLTQSLRLKNWNYTSEGPYFITICTYNKQCYFGQIKNGVIGLSPAGNILALEWQRTFRMRQNIQMDTWVIMPNHFHAVIHFNSQEKCSPRPPETQNVASLQMQPCKNVFGKQQNNLGAVIRGFKASTTTKIRMLIPSFSWQPNYYDHIIRDDKELNTIREYILFNPSKWHLDRDNPTRFKQPPP